MGRASRWLKSLFGIKNSKEYSNSGDGQDKKRCRIGHSGRGPSGGLCHNPTPNMSPAESVWLRSCYYETKKEQSMHAIAVAAATAAAADAAVAAAQAAVAVVRLTSHGRGTMFGGGQERWAAIKIQTVFRGYLARKALRALKGLVKIQALVRGYLVRKRAKATLYSMHALMRAQATIRSQKARGIINHDANRFDIRARKSMERFDHTRSEQTVSIHSRRLSASLDTAKFNIDESAKIVEVDTGGPKSRSRRTNTSASDFGDYLPCKALSSPPTSRFPARLRIPDSRHFQETDWRLTGDECGFSTAQSTPFFRHCGDFPKYMANTQSFKAKSRAHSAPKQRPEPGPEKLLSRNEMMESRSSLSRVRKQRSCLRVQEAINFRNAVMEKLDRPSEFGRDPERNHLQKR